ncbi:MAG: hypothetical protein JOZ66_06680 [Hyphomicrobiales bacterium]|nr:hypothetical protein [Hyphomicrobiales bacterium]
MRAWTVAFVDEFLPEIESLAKDVRRELLAMAQPLEAAGPQLGRPQGVSQSRFYRRLIATADARYGAHLERIR